MNKRLLIHQSFSPTFDNNLMATLLHHFENLLKMAKFKVLDIIKNNPILYDTEHENFYNAKLKSLAKLAVLKKCTSMLPSEITFEVLTRKIRNFQRSYNRRKKKPKVSPNLYNSQHKICTQNCNLLISFCCDVFFFFILFSGNPSFSNKLISWPPV